MSRDWSGLVLLEFLDTTEVLTHSIPNWSFGFSYILEVTFVAIYNVNYITQFTSQFVFGGGGGNDLYLNTFLVWKLVIWSSFLSLGQ